MHDTDDRTELNGLPPAGDTELTHDEYQDILDEIEVQPSWRGIADKEMDYADGNQLDSELLQKQAALGIPPAVEDLIGPALLSIQGYEAATRTDWRVTPDGDPEGEDVADALNYRLVQAEREAKADRACSDAFRPQVACGIGWVEVSRESDPFKYPYRCLAVHRNEINWDMRAQEWDQCRWLRRQRWLPADRLALTFPEHAELIQLAAAHGGRWIENADLLTDGGHSTGLNNAWNEARSWTIAEDRWYNPESKELCVSEVWYRRWVSVFVLKTPDGRVVEYDPKNLAHNVALASGRISPKKAVVARVRRSYWIGPHRLYDGPSPYTHRHFPYVPFFGFREDLTGVPYGYVRGMKYAQDSVNSGISKLRWGMSAYRVERTEGAIAMPEDVFRRTVGRVDADIILDAQHMTQPGARFEVKRDFQLNDQQFQLLNDNRQSIQRVSAVTSGFMGKEGTATSGLQERTQVEQSNQSLGRIMDNFRAARTMVGELLLAMIIEDIGNERTEILVEGDAVTPDRKVVLNEPQRDPVTGMVYLSNDLMRTRLKVSLNEVPSTAGYREQQLQALTEAIKPLPPEYLQAAIPYLVALMDAPWKRELIEAFRNVANQITPEQVEQEKQAAAQQALKDAGIELKARELEIKERKADSEIRGLDAKAVQIGVQAAFAAMQAGAQIAQMPMIAPIADEVMKGAGYQRPNPAGVDPNFPMPEQVAAMNIKSPYIQGQGPVGAEAAPPVRENTSPGFPPVPDDGASPMQGIETPETTDNLNAGV